MSSLTTSKAWTALQSHYHQTKNDSLRDVFKRDTNRFNKFSVNFNDILFDYSKNRITDQTLHFLIDLANHAELNTKISAMFSGEKIKIVTHVHTAEVSDVAASIIRDAIVVSAPSISPQD